VCLYPKAPAGRTEAQTLLEIPLLAQCPVTGRHTPTLSRQRGTLLVQPPGPVGPVSVLLEPAPCCSLGALLMPLGERKGTGET